MAGGLMLFGDALKAFRRNVYTFPEQWTCAVICASHSQAKYAMDETRAILDASSLPVQSFMHTSMKITTDRGGSIQFIVREHALLQDRLAGYHFPHIIIIDPSMPESDREYIKAHLRHPEIQDRYFRLDEATI